MYESPNLNDVVEMVASGRKITLAEAIEYFEISTIIKRFGQWVVTEYGLECLVIQYAIRAERLAEQDWVSHMSDKRWVNMEEFESALKFAKECFGIIE